MGGLGLEGRGGWGSFSSEASERVNASRYMIICICGGEGRND